jgi:hypothetical protein
MNMKFKNNKDSVVIQLVEGESNKTSENQVISKCVFKELKSFESLEFCFTLNDELNLNILLINNDYSLNFDLIK